MKLLQDIVEYYRLFSFDQFNVVCDCLQKDDDELLRACGKSNADSLVQYDVIEYICKNLDLPADAFIPINNQILMAWKILSIPSIESIDMAYDIFLRSFLLSDQHEPKKAEDI
jgi:hypothetical protein